ncbi:hypothetical protein OS493_036594 [Desmophyllum pertusum]|uniref:Uncharacterized protein n=1 Tax=Desmophyllum pertusum TaxID=174260 RepID=A0A9W9ZX60_9CNID|nr:hypothetical protein OS493_036594 [Desmophyllum pertusum]
MQILRKYFASKQGKPRFPKLFGKSSQHQSHLTRQSHLKFHWEIVMLIQLSQKLKIPEDALMKDDGTIYSGQANLRLSLMDPRNASDVMTAPGDFSTIDEDGEEQMLVTYGMLRVDFEDDTMETLRQNCGGWTRRQEDGLKLDLCGWRQTKPAEASEALDAFW